MVSRVAFLITVSPCNVSDMPWVGCVGGLALDPIPVVCLVYCCACTSFTHAPHLVPSLVAFTCAALCPCLSFQPWLVGVVMCGSMDVDLHEVRQLPHVLVNMNCGMGTPREGPYCGCIYIRGEAMGERCR